MICLETVKRYCKEYWKIENYQEAVNDTEQVWDCHHRHEIDWVLPREELISIGRYYDVHYSELIFITHSDHISLHQTGKEGPWKGKVGPNKGKRHTEETKQKISNANKGKHRTEEVKQKIGNALKGENNPNYKYHITLEELYDLYVLQGLSQQKIAKMYGCSICCIWCKLKKYGIIKHGK